MLIYVLQFIKRVNSMGIDNRRICRRYWELNVICLKTRWVLAGGRVEKKNECSKVIFRFNNFLQPYSERCAWRAQDFPISPNNGDKILSSPS